MTRAQHPRRCFGIAAAIALWCAGQAPAVLAEPIRFKIDPDHFNIIFFVDHIGYQRQFGFFREAEGAFTFDPDTKAISDLSLVIEAKSVWSDHKKRDIHLRSPDFLNVKEFPEILFTMTGSEALTEKTGRIDGDLTILGVTRPISIDITLNKVAKYPFGGGFGGPPLVAGISGRMVVKRSEFGMTYAIEQGWVGDELEVILEIEARAED